MSDTILILSSKRGHSSSPWKPAMLLKSGGEQQELACFERDDATEAQYSCAINWNNQLFVFGGILVDRRQISRLTGHKLERVGSLDFDHYIGGCSVMNNEFIYLCFNSGPSSTAGPYDHKRCRRSTGPMEQFSEVALSTHSHAVTKTSCTDCKFREVGKLFNGRNTDKSGIKACHK